MLSKYHPISVMESLLSSLSVLLYRFKEDGEEVHLDNIETDEEFEKVSNVFSEIFEQEFEEEE